MSKRYLAVFSFITAALVVAILITPIPPSLINTKVESHQPVVTTTPAVRSDLELHTFWNMEMSEIYQSIVDGKSYPEINKHFQEYQNKIFQKTHKSLNIQLSTSYHWASPLVEASGGYDEKLDSAVMEIYVPSLMNGFEVNQKFNNPRWKEAFRSHFLILFMHEMEHIVILTPAKKSVDLEEESRAWYDTCTYTIAPLIQNHHLPISGDSYILYQAWLASNGNRSNPVWYEAIHNLYSPILGKSK